MADMKEELRRLMSERGWTQTRLAQEAHISQKQISRVLRGEQKFRASSERRVFSALNRQSYSLNPEIADFCDA